MRDGDGPTDSIAARAASARRDAQTSDMSVPTGVTAANAWIEAIAVTAVIAVTEGNGEAGAAGATADAGSSRAGSHDASSSNRHHRARSR